MNSHTTDDQLEVLRARLQLELTGHSAVVVTSAMTGDGKSVLAFGLAESLAKASQRVLLIDANHHRPQLSELPVMTPVGGRSNGVPTYPIRRLVGGFDGLSFADARLASELSKESVREALAWAKARYDVVIIDTAPVLRSSLALFFAAAADATLMALRQGRPASSDDRAALAALDRVNAQVLGVVTTTRAAQKAFERSRAGRFGQGEPTHIAVPSVENLSVEDRSPAAIGSGAA